MGAGWLWVRASCSPLEGVDALLRTAGGELWTALAEQGDEPLAALQGRLGDPERSTAFDDERIEFRLNASNPESVRQQLEQAIEVVIGQGSGWLRLQAEVEDDRTACLTAAIDVSHAFAQDGTSGVADGGSLSAAWGQLEGSSWTPPVRVSTHRALPAALRGQRPLPGKSPDTIAIGDVNATFAATPPLEMLRATCSMWAPGSGIRPLRCCPWTTCWRWRPRQCRRRSCTPSGAP